MHYRDYMDHPVFAMKRGTFEMGYNDEEKNPLFGNGFAHSIFRLMDVISIILIRSISACVTAKDSRLSTL